MINKPLFVRKHWTSIFT